MVDGLDNTMAASPRKEARFLIVQEAGLTLGQVWTIAENVASAGIRYPYGPVRRNSLY